MRISLPPIQPNHKINICSMYSFYIQTFPPNFHFDGERHNFWELNYVLSGEIGITDEEKLFECKPGDLVLHAPDNFHTCWNLRNFEVKTFTIAFNGDGLLESLLEVKVSLNDEERRIMDLLIAEIKKCIPKEDALKSYSNYQIIKNYLEILCFKLSERKPTVLQPQTRLMEKYRKMMLYLKEHICDNLTIETMARELYESPSTLKRIFKKFANCGIMNYYNTLRINYAIHLVNEGKKINEISDLMNFSSQNYFSYFFKKYTGLSPSDYQKH